MGGKVFEKDKASYTPPVRVTIPTCDSANLWSPVVVKGEPASCFGLYRMLSQLTGGEIDDVICELPLPRLRHATIIGSKGATIRKLSADSNARIAVPGKVSKGT